MVGNVTNTPPPTQQPLPAGPAPKGTAPAGGLIAPMGNLFTGGVPTNVQVQGAAGSPSQGVDSKPPLLKSPSSGSARTYTDPNLQKIQDAINNGINTVEDATALLALISGAMLDVQAQGLSKDTAARQKELQANAADQLQKIKDAAAKATQSENKSWWSKLWGAIKAVVSVIVAAALTVAAAATANPVLLVMGAMMLYNSVVDTINSVRAFQGKEPLDINFSFGKAAAWVAGKLGASEETQQWIQIGVDIAAAVAMVALTFMVPGGQFKAMENLGRVGKLMQKLQGLFSNADKVRKVGAAVQAGGAVVAGGAAIGQGVTTIQAANYKYESAQSQADLKTMQIMYQKLQAIVQQLLDMLNSTEQAKSDIFGGASETLNRSAQVNATIFKGPNLG